MKKMQPRKLGCIYIFMILIQDYIQQTLLITTFRIPKMRYDVKKILELFKGNII